MHNSVPWWMNKKNEASDKSIETLIFMDFETSGLFRHSVADPLMKRIVPGDSTRNPKQMLNNFCTFSDCTDPVTSPRITEMSFLSVPRKVFEMAMEKMVDKYTLLNEELPICELSEEISVRVAANVHTRQLNPNFSKREWQQYVDLSIKYPSVVRLSKDELLTKHTFDVEWPSVCDFLELVPKPACLIAYNGVRFDYRCLMQELRRYNLIQKFPLPDDIYFLDAYFACLDIEKYHHEYVKRTTQSINWCLVTELVLSASESKLNRKNFNDTPTKITKDVETQTTVKENQINNVREESNPINASVVNWNDYFPYSSNCVRSVSSSESKNVEAVLKRPAQNLCGTPQKRFLLNTNCLSRSEPPIRNEGDTSSSLLVSEYRSAHPLRFISSTEWPPAKKRRMRSEFFQRKNTGDWYFNENDSFNHFIAKGNFKLETLYSQIIGGTYRAHCAQDDSYATIQICLAHGNDFLHYLDAQSSKFPALFYGICCKNSYNADTQNAIIVNNESHEKTTN